MSQRYEFGAAADTGCEVVAPDNPWHTIWDADQPPPAPGTRALVIGNPWASAYAVLGTPPELEQFIIRQMASLHRACPGELGQHAEPAVTHDPALLADWLSTQADTLRLTGHYTPLENIASRLEYLIFELRSKPRIWRTAAEVGRISVYPTALAEADLADFGAVVSIDVGPLRLATDHLAASDLTGLIWDGDQLPSMPWPKAAQRAITTAAEVVNDLVARWRTATAAYAADGRPTPEGAQPRRDHHTR
jgi:hypothetical protein